MNNRQAIIALLIILLVGVLIVNYIIIPKMKSHLPIYSEQENYSWSMVEDGVFLVYNTSCTGPKYTCTYRCYDTNHIDIWVNCHDLGFFLTINTGSGEHGNDLPLFCFESGCIPKVEGDKCYLICPEKVNSY